MTATSSTPRRLRRFSLDFRRIVRSTGVGAGAVAALVGVGVIASGEREASASVFDISASGGVIQRSLSTTDYQRSYTVQAQAELGIVPSLLYIGPYANYSRLVPQLAMKADAPAPDGAKFYGVGLRARIVIPVPGPVSPYAIGGVGLVHADFPDQNVSLCSPQIGPVAPQCTTQSLPAATANFVELTLGAGLRFDLSDDFRLFVEASWKPTFGYQNDTWEKTAHQAETTGNTNPGSPSRNGYALVGAAGLMISL